MDTSVKNLNFIDNIIIMYLFVTILLTQILVGAEIDIFVPSFPDLQDSFKVSTFMVELLLGINLLAHCFTALVVGNLGDKFGRKTIIILGLIIFIIGSIFCTCAMNYYILLFGRFLQGIGISGVAVLGYIVLADLYSVEQQKRMIGTLNGVITLAMAFAPVMGSYINLLFSWRGNFSILLIFGIICLILAILYIPKGQINHNVKISLKEYIPVFRSKKSVLYLFTIIFMAQAYWVFIAIAPILYMKDLGVPLKEFGLYQGALAMIFCIGSFSSGYMLKKFGQTNCFFSNILCLVAFIIIAIISLAFEVHSPLLITATTALISVGVIFPCNILIPMMLDTIPSAKARINAILVSGRLILTTICLQLVSYFYDGTHKALALTMSLTLIISLIGCYKLLCVEKIFATK